MPAPPARRHAARPAVCSPIPVPASRPASCCASTSWAGARAFGMDTGIRYDLSAMATRDRESSPSCSTHARRQSRIQRSTLTWAKRFVAKGAGDSRSCRVKLFLCRLFGVPAPGCQCVTENHRPHVGEFYLRRERIASAGQSSRNGRNGAEESGLGDGLPL